MNILTTRNATLYSANATATAVATDLSDDHAPAVPYTFTYAGNDGAVGAVRHPAPTRFGVRHIAGILMLASLLACGSMPGERAISGAGIGAGAGAALGAVTGMGVGTGAAIGAAAGAAAGGLTDEDDVNLGKPVWK